jgi:type I restriction enzyme R subunit
MTQFIDKKKLSEQDISTKFIVPAIQNSGWDLMLQVSEQKLPITKGRIILNGKLITVSFKDFSKNQILKKFSSLDDFINKWSKQEQKILIIQELENQGIDFFELQNEIGDIGKNIDPFDLILHIAFGKNKLITRQERVKNLKKKNYLDKYSGIAKNVLENLLEKYADQGVAHIEDIKILTINPFNSIGSPIEIIQEFGGRDAYFLAVRELEREIYSQNFI